MSNDPFPVYEKCCVVCVKEREIYFKTWAHEPRGLVCPEVQGWQAGWRLREGLMLHTESKGGLDDSVAGLTLFSLRFRKIVSLSSLSYCKIFKRPVCLAFLCSYF